MSELVEWDSIVKCLKANGQIRPWYYKCRIAIKNVYSIEVSIDI